MSDKPLTIRRMKTLPRPPFDHDALANLSIDSQKADGKELWYWFDGHDGNGSTGFAMEKCLRGDFLRWTFVVMTRQIPPAVFKQKLSIAVKALAGDEPPTLKHKREAREMVMAELEDLAKDGRWDRHTLIPITWHVSGDLWYGNAANTHISLFQILMKKCFDLDVQVITPREIDPSATPPAMDSPAWTTSDFNGWANMWGLHLIKEMMKGEDTFDGTTIMISKKLTMDDPKGDRDQVVLNHTMPVRMPECGQAIKQGKLPTQMEVQVVQSGDDEIWKFGFNFAQWVITGLKMPKLDITDRTQRELQLLEMVRNLLREWDNLFVSYLDQISNKVEIKWSVSGGG